MNLVPAKLFSTACLSVAFFVMTVTVFAQKDVTIKLKSNQILVIGETMTMSKNDTIIVIPKGTDYQIYDSKYVLSDGFYDSIYSKAQRRRLTKELYNLLITNRPPQNGIKNKEPIESEDFFDGFEGKIITSIKYRPVELFGGSVRDTTLIATSNLGKLTNRLHQDTRRDVIFKHLLFDIGDELDAYAMADTERIIRSLSYIEDARIYVRLKPEDLNTVEVTIVAKDRFPWSVNFAYDNNGTTRVGFTNQNILGSGNEASVGYLRNQNEVPQQGYDASYTMRNIDDTFIDGTVYVSDNFNGRTTGITVKKDFVSPTIKYYGEGTVEHAQPIEDLVFADSLYEKDFRIERTTYDFWGARAFLIGERHNISGALRLRHDNFVDRPAVQADSNTIYHDHHFLVGSISYSKINFLKTKNILSFNITEDMPVGYIYSLVYGKDWTEFGLRGYRGFRSIYATYNEKAGYFLLNLEAGYFSQDNRRNDRVFQFNGRHFTPLFDLGSAYSRIFTRFHYFNGEELSIPISQTLQGDNRIRNIDGNQIEGDQIFTLTSEYVVFQPWYFYGFRFATYGHLGVGHVRESRSIDPYERTYYTMGGGIRIRNESLVFGTFEFRVSLIPNSTREGKNFFFKVTLSTPQFFRSPTIGKPRIVGLD